MKKVTLLGLVLGLAVLLVFPVGAWAQDTDADTASFTATIADTVYISQSTGSQGGNKTINPSEAQIVTGYFPLPDMVSLNIDAITDWEVTASVGAPVTTFPGLVTGTAVPADSLEIQELVTPGWNAGGGLVENTTNCNTGNTAGSSGYDITDLDFQIDLFDLGNAADAETILYAITFTVTEQ